MGALQCNNVDNDAEMWTTPENEHQVPFGAQFKLGQVWGPSEAGGLCARGLFYCVVGLVILFIRRIILFMFVHLLFHNLLHVCLIFRFVYFVNS